LDALDPTDIGDDKITLDAMKQAAEVERVTVVAWRDKDFSVDSRAFWKVFASSAFEMV
jgi:hypothetical protein